MPGKPGATGGRDLFLLTVAISYSNHQNSLKIRRLFGLTSMVDRAVAQLVARTLGVREVVSSNLAGPTKPYFEALPCTQIQSLPEVMGRLYFDLG